MNENAKKGILIAVIVAALGAVAFTFMKTSSADEPTVVKTIGGPVVNEKDAAIARQKGGAAPSSGVPADEAGGG